MKGVMKKKLVHVGNGKYVVRYEESMGTALWTALIIGCSAVFFGYVCYAVLLSLGVK